MYKITYIHRGETKENSLYIPGDADYCLTDAQLDLEMGKAGELNISIPYDNPARQDIECLTDEVIFYRDDEEIWRGRPVTIQVDFDRTGTLTCEGILAYLYDTYYEPFEFAGSPSDLFRSIIKNHNSHVESIKQFTIGEITVTDPNDYINRSSIYYDRSLNVLTEKLINDSLGGYFRVRVDGSTRYIDYLSNYDSTATQAVEFGENILDIAEDIEYSELATVILPLGAKLEDSEGTQTDEYTTIASVNGGSIYYEDPTMVSAYGWICVSAEWEDVTSPSNLLDRAKDYLAQVTNAVSSFTINAVDLSLISSEEPIDVGDYVRIRSTAHGINNYVELTARTIYPLAPENDVLQFGAQSTLTGSDRNTTRAIISAINSQATRITHLSTDVLDAIYANIQYLDAQVAYIETAYVTTEYVDELVANEITAAIINAGFLTADSAVITDLTAFAANIYTLLGGEGAFGELQSVHLTSDNAVIDTAVIINAIAGTILADMIEAEYIDTDLISIHSEDGTLWIDGSTMLIYDADGNPRIQIGLDELGDYNLALWDEDGNCMWNATGATEYGLNDGIIRDITVADDANISGYKLNIEEICSIINSDGAYEIDASSVTINGQTLDAWYGVITEEIEGLEGLSFEGLISVEPWFTLWYSDTISPDDETIATICGQFLCGQALCGYASSATWVDYDIPTEEGLYKWVKWLGTYADGHTEWSIPYCLTDGYIRTTTGVLQTELEVVQGWISERVWYTEIMDAVDTLIETDVWSELNIWLNGIELEVGEMQSTFTEQYESLVVQVAGIYLDVDSITSRVESTEQQIGNLEYAIENLDLEGVSYFETFFCLSDSDTEAPAGEETKQFNTWFAYVAGVESVVTFDVAWEDYTPISVQYVYIQGEIMTDFDISSSIDGNTATVRVTNIAGGSDYSANISILVLYTTWVNYDIDVPDGEYKWVKYLLYYEDGHTEWTTPYCLTDSYVRTQMSEIVQTTTSITERVTSVETWLGDGYSSSLSLNTLIEQYVDEGKAEIIIEVSRDYALKTDLDDVVEYTDAQIKAVADDTSASIDVVAKALESAEDEWSVSVAEIRAYVDSEISNITLSVSGTLGGEASITIQAGGGTSTDYLDLSLVREVFAKEDSSVTITAGLIQFGSGTLTIDSKQFTLDTSGNATFSGHLSAPSGTIGGWEISSTSLYNGTDSMSSTTNGTYLGSTSGIRQYANGDYINITGAALTNGNSDNSKAELTQATLRFTHSGVLLGHYGTEYYTEEPSKFGLVIGTEYECNYVAFGRKTSTSADVYTWDYVINHGLSADALGYSERHIFYGDVRFTSALTYFSGGISVAENYYVIASGIQSMYSSGLYIGDNERRTSIAGATIRLMPVDGLEINGTTAYTGTLSLMSASGGTVTLQFKNGIAV